jgi:hypothetical protein
MENLDINQYSITELMEILNINNLNLDEINRQSNAYIQKFKEEENEPFANFFQQAKIKLTGAFKDKTVNDWYKKESLPQNDSIQANKITSRTNKVQEFDGVLNREQLGINQTHNIPYVQGSINPTLKNTTSKLVMIDSKFRSNNILKDQSKPLSCIKEATQFTMDLTEQLTRVTMLQLNSVHIPYTWYNIPENSNSFMFVSINNDGDENEKVHTITPGNYSILTLKTNFDKEVELSQDQTTGKLSMTFKEDGTVTFYSDNDKTQMNNTLGWLLGFREFSYEVKANTALPAEAFPDLNGPKYFLLYLDDFNMNRTNNGLVSIHNTETKIKLPDYYKPSNLNGLKNIPPNCSKSNNKGVSVPFFTQDLPRTITQAQQYSVNEIIKNRKIAINNKLLAPNPSNILAIIPVKTTDITFGEMFVKTAETLNNNKRTYFGPVDIERFETKLLDDKGNQVNLNGSDWSYSLICEQLYQY